ncbi:SAM-dependent methyltransferase [Amycolatopsis cynarae]|uniref:SAM-dependent methyltransferase n=1 Tax=Amycolatopsis cynarae TaxID=2995223 RepID=A0ABY7B260_9PSEU|nr:SAM-dependent methyltransferase [Amycolatopsis sp. HUAS 11-8]WAL66390.1 SAM-dependent methyltransferase [Amycolatopsis sp. HUAS 11-8]
MKDRRETVSVPEGVDLDHPNAARVYDYFLGGTANWAIDRMLGDQLSAVVPIIRTGARVNREFLGRAVRYCLRQGITQFLDLGSGVPTVGNVHEVADAVDPDSRCVYVDREPVAVAHARVLIEDDGDPERHVVLHEDLRNVNEVWKRAVATGVLDPSRPVGLLMVSVLHFLDPQEQVSEVVAQYRSFLPSGSHLIISHATFDAVPEQERQQFQQAVELYHHSGNPAFPRPREVIADYFGDFPLVEPGLVWLPEWHVEDGPAKTSALLAGRPAACCFLGGIGVKP